MPSPHSPTICGGRFRGRRLDVPPGLTVRPTRSLVRMALFNMLGERVPGARVLDLYSGSGALGLEALSRGAERVVSVERDRRALAALRGNAERCGVTAQQHRIVAADAAHLSALDEGGFDLVLADPPFARAAFLPPVLDVPGVLAAEAWLAVHLPSDRGRADLGTGWSAVRDRIHGRSRLLILERVQPG